MTHPFAKIDSVIRPWLGIVFVLVVAVVALTYGFIAERSSQQNSASISGSCSFWSDLAQIPLSPTSTKTAFVIVADARSAFERQNCKGTLPAPDPRVIPYLK